MSVKKTVRAPGVRKSWGVSTAALSFRAFPFHHSCDTICDIILLAVPANRCKSLHVNLTDLYTSAIVAANRCILLQALASAKAG
jgi:hypothetical protein